MTRSARVLSRTKEASYPWYYDFLEMVFLEILGAKVQQSLSVDMLGLTPVNIWKCCTHTPPCIDITCTEVTQVSAVPIASIYYSTSDQQVARLTDLQELVAVFFVSPSHISNPLEEILQVHLDPWKFCIKSTISVTYVRVAIITEPSKVKK